MSVLPHDGGEFLVKVQTPDIMATKKEVAVGRDRMGPAGIHLDPGATEDVVDVKHFGSELIQGLWALH